MPEGTADMLDERTSADETARGLAAFHNQPCTAQPQTFFIRNAGLIFSVSIFQACHQSDQTPNGLSRKHLKTD